MRPVILASASPRRRELLALGGVAFRAVATAIPEAAAPGEAPEAMAVRLSRAKAHAAAAEAEPGAILLGADTDVVLTEAVGETILGKPRDAADAAQMLRRLRGREHHVLTALTVLDTASGGETTDLISVRVPMRAYTEAEIAAYVLSGDPLDKAGAYAIQYPAFQPVDLTRFEGCFATVMGLPVCRVLERLRGLGLAAGDGLAPADCDQPAPGRCPIEAQLEAARRR
jgi:septum formation protein